MELEPRQVLLKQRWNPFTGGRDKEWWYTGISDETNGVYIGFSVIRVKFIDSISVTVFDPAAGKPVHAGWKGFLKPENPPNQLCLKAKGRNFVFSYTGSEEDGWNFELDSPEITARLRIEPELPHFTKFDNFFVDDYMLIHWFGNRAKGTVTSAGRTYSVNDGRGYLDHCAGTVPGKTKWHWIAVQNERCSLASLMNYGVYPQCYTQAYLPAQGAVSGPGANKDPSPFNRWIRLDQDVSFECYHKDRFNRHWRITSPDMHLKMIIVQSDLERERIPPLIPFLVKLDHWHCSVTVAGHIRVDGVWIETGVMHGVFEEHFGNW